MNDEKEQLLVPVSSLSHYLYCPRECALIHLEQTFTENWWTLHSRLEHRRVHEPGTDFIQGERVERALPLFSDRLGLIGKADIVEFHQGVPFPVEYKHARRRRLRDLDVQLCAQALCLEEMFSCTVPRGAIYHISSRRRRQVTFTDDLRRLTLETIQSVRTLLGAVNSAAPAGVLKMRPASGPGED